MKLGVFLRSSVLPFLLLIGAVFSSFQQNGTPTGSYGLAFILLLWFGLGVTYFSLTDRFKGIGILVGYAVTCIFVDTLLVAVSEWSSRGSSFYSYIVLVNVLLDFGPRLALACLVLILIDRARKGSAGESTA